jgi:hypothetical protein
LKLGDGKKWKESVGIVTCILRNFVKGAEIEVAPLPIHGLLDHAYT